MKSSQGGAPLESSLLKGFCDRHVPPDWRRENEVGNAILDAQDYYAYKMSDSLWADSRYPHANAGGDYYHDGHDHQHQYHPAPPNAVPGEAGSLVLSNGGSPLVPSNARRRKSQPMLPNKIVWKLPSGAPVIPQIVFNAVCDSLVKFNVRKRKEYVSDACKYWTLKREARRGAGLIKRLQLTEPSSELARRNWKGLSQGRKKLQRRLEFASNLKTDVEHLKVLSSIVKNREQDKWKIADMMREFVDNVYFPEVPLMWPIFEKAQS